MAARAHDPAPFILSLSQSQVRTLDFDAGPLRSLDLYGSVTEISREFSAPSLSSLQLSFEEGVPVTTGNCPIDHQVPLVAATCRRLTRANDGR